MTQEGFLFSRSIAENITLGREDADAARVREAAVAAGVADETDGFLAGFDTVVGERGLTLSGGQRQRVALARALVGRPPILVLDDPFASVDASKEEEIVGNLRALAQGRTVLLMTHRLRAAQLADRVVVLDAGRVVEQGRHDDLILRDDWLGLTWIACLYVGALVLLYGLRWLEAYLMNLTGQRVIHDLRAALFAHLLRLEAAFFDRTPVGRLMTRVLGDVEAVSEAFTSGLFAVIADVITLAGVVGVMLWLDWHLALVTFSIFPALVVAAGYFRIRARDAYRRVRQRLAHLNGLLQESLQGVAVIQLFARECHEAGRFREANRAYRRALFASTIYEASLYASVEALGSIALAVLLWYGGREIIAGAVSFGVLVAFIQYTNRFFLPIRGLGAKYTVMQSAMASSERIFGLLDRPPAIVSVGRATAPGQGSQAPRLSTGTVGENSKLGADGAVAPADLARAVETARAAAFVAALPRGLDEALGERGANVSHGQRQLLAIARALVYNPAVLVLDEATSSVDAESEALIREAMSGLLAGRTSLTIAHRLSTVQHADRILVLHRGRIHEEGSHAALLRRGGLYARLTELQAGSSAA